MATAAAELTLSNTGAVAAGTAGLGGAGAGIGGGTGSGHHHKSFKRKYRKLKLRFDAVMKQSDDLFRKDIIATAQVKRITEENVRLLDLLLDLNSSPHIPHHRHYNIGSPSCSTPVGFLSPEQLAAFQNAENEDEDVEPMDLDEKKPHEVDSNATQEDDNNTKNIVLKPANGAGGDNDDTESELSSIETPSPESPDYPRDIPEYDELSASELELEEAREEKYKRRQPGTPPLYVRVGREGRERRSKEKENKRSKKAAGGNKTNGAVAGEGNRVIKTEPGTDEKGGEGAVKEKNAAGEKAAAASEKQKPISKQQPRILLPPPDLYPSSGTGGPTTPPYLRDPSPFLMSPEEEDEWYQHIDLQMERALHARGGDEEATHSYPSGVALDETVMNARNPMGVYAWLKRNQPQIFLQDTSSTSGGAGGGAEGGGGGGSGVAGSGTAGAGDGTLGGGVRKVRGKPGPKRKVPVDDDEGGGRRDSGAAAGKRKRKGAGPGGGVEVDDGLVTPVGQRGGQVLGSATGSGGKGAGGSGGRGGRRKGGERERERVEDSTPVSKKIKR
ncbi:IEC3 subunit of the Ino80 complex, chromatin re-modelling-domain-containing protein [Kalaharituber pfeilii]|nr:IEC3 subunit of the Ino80 complex, chromatin re-modelling-domain-containing protein [Kalaharituber pfeilii]